MSTTQCRRGRSGQTVNGQTPPADLPRVLHRIAEVRREQQVSSRAVASRMNTTVAVVDRQQKSTCDLMLSDLYRWQAALDVPVADLLVEPGEGLSPSIRLRAELLKVVKTVRLMEHYAQDAATQRLVTQLRNQLTDMIPEYEHVEAWPKVGQRRAAGDVAFREEHPVPAWLVEGV